MTNNNEKAQNVQIPIWVVLVGQLGMSNLSIDRKELLDDKIFDLAKEAMSSLQSRLCVLLNIKVDTLKEATKRVDNDIDNFFNHYKTAN